MSLEGEFENFEEDIIDKAKLVERGRAKFQELRELQHFLSNPEEW